MACDITSRLTSKDLVIQYLPCGVAATHVQHLYFHADVTAGTFKLRVDGELTAAITFSATPATLITNIDAALDALPNLSAAEIASSGGAVTDMTLTASGNGFYNILIEDIDSLTGNSTADPNLTTAITTQGSSLVTISSEISSFGFEASVETTDVTGISEFERTQIPVAEVVSFDMSVYKADQSWGQAVKQGNWGTFYVYPEGKVVGNEIFAFNGLIESVGETYPDHEKVEKEISGMRNGPWVLEPGSVYRG